MFFKTTILEYPIHDHTSHLLFPRFGYKNAKLYYHLRCQELDEYFGAENNVKLKRAKKRIAGYYNPQHQVIIEWVRGADLTYQFHCFKRRDY